MWTVWIMSSLRSAILIQSTHLPSLIFVPCGRGLYSEFEVIDGRSKGYVYGERVNVRGIIYILFVSTSSLRLHLHTLFYLHISTSSHPHTPCTIEFFILPPTTSVTYSSESQAFIPDDEDTPDNVFSCIHS